ncbi:MAG TPA: hypothetical protein ENG51_13580 [Deltaproteobacteria bacterium]|nr:hypothetical protein [Deltaproteobacteria bacterium]
MVNRSYRKGYRFEKTVQKWFEEQGFFVIRQGKSRFPDLIAIPPAGAVAVYPRFIECKYNKMPRKDEIERMRELSERYKVVCGFAIKKKGKKGFEIKWAGE